MKIRGIVLFWVILVMAGCAAMAQSMDKSHIAAEAANRWLGYADSGDYAKSWDTSSTYFQKVIGKEDWEKQLAAIRSPLGSVVSREQMSASFSTQLPGAPDADYVIVRYNSRYEHKRSAIETVTMTYDRDRWRLAGYYIK